MPFLAVKVMLKPVANARVETIKLKIVCTKTDFFWRENEAAATAARSIRKWRETEQLVANLSL